VLARSQADGARVPALPVDVTDTVGAGDAFSGGLLSWLEAHDKLDRDSVASLGGTELVEALEFAVAVSSLQCTHAGATCPTLAEVDAFLSRRAAAT
jgi:fructokinase